MNCRLPQTPRTPSTAAAHYFDDIWAKGKKEKGPRPLRRSSTTRNIGNGESANGNVHPTYSHNRANSVGYFDDAALAEKAEMDRHVASYVSDQLQRMRSNDSASAMAMEDEVEVDHETVSDGDSEFEVHSPVIEKKMNGLGLK